MITAGIKQYLEKRLEVKSMRVTQIPRPRVLLSFRGCLHFRYLHRRQSAAMASVSRIARATTAADRLLLLWMLALGRKTSSQRAPV